MSKYIDLILQDEFLRGTNIFHQYPHLYKRINNYCIVRSRELSIPHDFEGYDIRNLLTYAIIPEGITSISSNTFRNCIYLRHVKLPQSLWHIGSYAFSGCFRLKYINLPQNLKEIEPLAFAHTDLRTIEIPNDIIELQYKVFYHCPKLRTVTFKERSGLFAIGASAFEGCNSLEKIDLPDDNLHFIRDNAFNGTALTSINIPTKIHTIKTQAFANCRYLTNISTSNIPHNFEHDAFYQTPLDKEAMKYESFFYRFLCDLYWNKRIALCTPLTKTIKFLVKIFYRDLNIK